MIMMNNNYLQQFMLNLLKKDLLILVVLEN